MKDDDRANDQPTGQALDKLLGDLLPAVDLEYSSYQDVRGLATTLSVSEKHALLFLRALKVPILYVPGRKLYSPIALETVLHVLTRYGGPGFIAPASEMKNYGGPYRDPDIPTEVSEEIQKEASDPRTLLEMVAVQKQNPSLTKALLSGGKSKKDDNERDSED